MRRMLATLLVALIASSVSGSEISLMSRDLGFATDVPVLGREFGWQGVSDVAVAGEIGWITWYDYNLPFQRGMLTRVSDEGNLLDPVGRPAGGYSTRLVEDGEGVRLYWVENQGDERLLLTQRASNDGTLSASVELLRVPSEPSNIGFDAVRGPSGLTLVAIGPHLSLVDGSRVVSQRKLEGWGQPTLVAALDDGWAVTWVSSGGFAMWIALDDELEPVGAPGGSAVSDGVSNINVLSEGDSFLYVVTGQIGLDVWRIEPRGTTTRIVELDLAFANTSLIRLSPSRHLLAWTVNGNIEGAEIVNDRIGPASVLLEDAGFAFSMADWNGNLLIADSQGGCIRGLCEFDVYSSLKTSAGTVTQRVSTAAARQTRPSLVIDNDTASAAWLQYDDGILSSNGVVAWGTRRGSGSFDVRTHSANKPLSFPSIAAYQGNRVLIWSTISLETLAPVLEGYLLGDNGEPAADLAFPLELEPQNAIVRGGPTGWLITWFEWNEGGRIAALLVGFDGKQIGGPIIVGDARAPQFDVCADATHHSFLVTWLDQEGEAGPYVLRTARITAEGLVSSGSDLGESPNFLVYPSIACGPELCLAAWSRSIAGDGNYDSFGRFIDPLSLAPASNTLTIADTPRADTSPLVQAFGDEWVITWSDSALNSSESVILATRFEGAPVDLPAAIEIGPASYVDTVNHALSCSGSECLSLRSLTVDDAVRGRTVQLMLSRITQSRHRGVRRGE